MPEQTVRVTAKGDFTQLQRGLKQLASDLKNVTGEIDRSARKGGFFDDSQIRALDFFGKRFKSTLQEMKDALQESGHAYERLLSLARQATGTERDLLQKEIKDREKVIDKIEQQISYMERLYAQRQKESDQFRNEKPGESGGSRRPRGTNGGSHDAGAPLVQKLLGAGQFMLGLAGLGSIMSVAMEAYNLAYQRNTMPLNLSQRIRGFGGRSGSATSMWDAAGNVGRMDNMGYTNEESWQFLDMYSRLAGTPSTNEQYKLMRFGRAYGLDTSEVAGILGSDVQSGGGLGSKIADAIAGSVEKSGMRSRVVEVMEANNELLKTLNTTFKDGSAAQILAYQTTLDTIGTANGMTQLTGANGANVISGLGGIFTPGNNNWEWMGIRALQSYNPKKYGNMDLFHLQESFQNGLTNSDNVAAMAQYIKQQSGGNKELGIRILQKWLQDGGYNASLQKSEDLYNVTNGLQAFSPDKLKAVMNGSIDSGALYDSTRKNEAGQNYLQNDSRFQAALSKAGQPIVDAVQGLKSSAATLLENIEKDVGDGNTTGGKIYDFLTQHWKELATVGGVAIVADNVMKLAGLMGMVSGFKGGALISLLSRVGIPAAIVGGGSYLLGSSFEKASNFIDKGGFNREGVAKMNYKAITGFTAPSWITDPSQLDPASSNYYKNDPRWKSTPEGQQASKFEGMTEDQKKDWLLNGGSPGGNGPSDAQIQGFQKWAQSQTSGSSDSGQSYSDKYKSLPWNDPFKLSDDIRKFLAGSPSTSSVSVLGHPNISAKQLDGKLGGLLDGYGSAFLEAGKKYGIDPTFLAAVAMQETGNGTSNALKTKNNVGGMMGSNGLMSFGSIRQGIDAMASNLKRNYVNDGLTTIGQIQQKYAPIGAANDPDNLNSNWTSGVQKYMSILNDQQLSQPLARTSSAPVRTESHVTVHLTGDGADRLSAMSKEQLVSLIKRTYAEQERQKRLTNPTRTVMA